MTSPVSALNANNSLSSETANTRPPAAVGAECIGVLVTVRHTSSPVLESRPLTTPNPDVTNNFPFTTAIPPPTDSLSVPDPSRIDRGSRTRSTIPTLPKRVLLRSLKATL